MLGESHHPHAAHSPDPDGGLSTSPFPPDEPTHPVGTLAFPGKVTVDGRRIAIADSGHHRVLVGTLDDAGIAMHVQLITGGVRGYANGTDARFDNPQGLAFNGGSLYVADAGNHCVREISLHDGATRTLAGIGRQLRGAVDEAKGALSSPWDLAVAGNHLYVAMAGVHQLWTIDLDTGQAEVFSGSGAEELHDAPHDEAAFAQPMSLVAGDELFITDAESSAIRRADISRNGAVHTVVGTGLFDFGDVDGAGDDVRLQHPQGIALATDGRLLLCDTYNDALKWLDPATRTVTTWVRGLHEPSGVALGDTHAYVADTNAHRIAVVELATGEISTLELNH